MAQTNSFDIIVTQVGDIYTVSGKDAVSLYTKLQQMPPGAKNLEVGKLKDGAFTLRKPVDHKTAAPLRTAAG